jgi:hypothetical protein
MLYCDKCEKRIEPDKSDGYAERFEPDCPEGDGIPLHLGPLGETGFDVIIKGDGGEGARKHYHPACIAGMVYDLIHELFFKQPSRREGST